MNSAPAIAIAYLQTNPRGDAFADNAKSTSFLVRQLPSIPTNQKISAHSFLEVHWIE
jgi:hypothetical protein